MMLFMMNTLIPIIGVLLSVAFFTLMERKIMGISHLRKGPNKVLLMGVLQPMSDALKLLTKEIYNLPATMLIMFLLGPIVSLCIMVISWYNFYSIFNTNLNNLKIMFIIAVMSLSVFFFLMCGWGSNTKYALLGTNRAISQVISYEVCMMMFLLIPFYLIKSYSLEKLCLMTTNMWASMWAPSLFLIWMTLCMAESNRTPFDLAEGESEIVSGFNIEYGGGLFALIFIAEYGMIMFMSFISSLVFMSSGFLIMKTLILCFIFVLTRCSFPRLRYDVLMMLAWKILLPMSLALLSLCMFIL